MAVIGIGASAAHPENGMPIEDMQAVLRAADALDEVIIFRSTGPWSRRWIERRYPTKNFHVKGKSSDWGPQSGFVPHLGIYSKVGHDETEAKKGTANNDKGLRENFARKVPLTLSMEELLVQRDRPEEVPARRAIVAMDPVPASRDFYLRALRSGDDREFVFRAVWNGSSTNIFNIHVYPAGTRYNDRRIAFLTPVPLEVMTSSEVGADNRPMTGDYDLMSVCPRWGAYGQRTTRPISKPGLNFRGKGVQQGLVFGAGINMDGVLDMRSNTGARPAGGGTGATYQGITAPTSGGLREHGDMGNLTPRILRAINTLNVEMRATGPLRRVHHNAESHRNHIFGALVAASMRTGDGLPMTAFQPAALRAFDSPMSRYGDVATLVTYEEFRDYVTLLGQNGYFVPRNWTWEMSVRDTHRNHIAWR